LVIPLVRGWAIGPSCGYRGCCWSPPSPCPPCSRSPSPQPTLVGYLTAGATPVWLLGSFAVLSLLYRAEVSTDQSAAAAEASVEPAPTSAAVAPSSAAAPQSGAEVLTKGAQAERVYAGPQRRWRAGQRWAAGRGGWAHPELRPCPGRPVPGPTTGRPPAQRSAGRPGRRGPRGRTMTSAALADRAGASRLVAALEHPWAIISVPASRRPPRSWRQPRAVDAGKRGLGQPARHNASAATGAARGCWGPGSHWPCPPIWAEPACRLGEAGAGVQ
jgi:hypothetical protein